MSFETEKEDELILNENYEEDKEEDLEKYDDED